VPVRRSPNGDAQGLARTPAGGAGVLTGHRSTYGTFCSGRRQLPEVQVLPQECEQWRLARPKLDRRPCVADHSESGSAAAFVRLVGHLGEASCREPCAHLVVEVIRIDSRQLSTELAASRPHQRGAGSAQLGCERDEPPDVGVGDVAEDADHDDDVGWCCAAVGVDAAGVDSAHLHLCQPCIRCGIACLLRKLGVQLQQHRRYLVGILALGEQSQQVSTIAGAKAQNARLARVAIESVVMCRRTRCSRQDKLEPGSSYRRCQSW